MSDSESGTSARDHNNIFVSDHTAAAIEPKDPEFDMNNVQLYLFKSFSSSRIKNSIQFFASLILLNKVPKLIPKLRKL